VRAIVRVVVVAGVIGAGWVPVDVRAAQSGLVDDGSVRVDRPMLSDAQRSFYNARYDDAATMLLELRSEAPDDLAGYELRTSALLFQLKALLGDQPNREKAFKACERCPDLMAAFLTDTTEGQALTRARLQADPADEEALFFLGKLNLNYVWLQLGPLGRKTGWNEYWEARRSLDAVLKRNPRHVRARVARAWIDYIVDTRMPWGTSWLLGGGNKKRAFIVMREAASTEADFFTEVEADFAIWDLHVRERKMTEAVEIARGLAQHFPENRELAKFLRTHDPD
jgi:tetratricopeptide (TPR) repeat protein